MSYAKVIRFESLKTWREYHRLTNQKVVATNGCFDILHRGHVSYLQKARQMGDLLIVGINSDRAVRELKGEDRPVNTQEDRAAVVAALACVDFVVVFDQVRAAEFLAAVQPTVWAKGGDYTIDTLDTEEVATVRESNGQIEIIPVVSGYSTTRTLHQLQASAEAEAQQVLEGDVPRRAEAPAADHGAGQEPEGGADAGAILRSRESLRR